MKILEFFKNIFKKRKELTEDVKKRIDDFIEYNKSHIQVLMKVLQFLYKKSAGQDKMLNVVIVICGALSEDIELIKDYFDAGFEYIQNKCQKIYDELKSNGGLDF